MVLRDPVIYMSRPLLYVQFIVIFAILFFDTRKLEQEQAQPRLFFLIFVVGFPAIFSLGTVYSCQVERLIVQKEIKDGMYWPISYLLIQLAILAPMSFVLAVFVLIPGVYPISNFNWAGFRPNTWIYGNIFLTFESIAHACSIFANPLLGFMQFINFWFMSLLFNGIMVPVDNVIWPFRVFSYSLPYRWAQAGFTYQAFIHTADYNGACPCMASLALNTTSLSADCASFYELAEKLSAGLGREVVAGMYQGNATHQMIVEPYCNMATLVDGFGFFCPSIPSTYCYGIKGAQLLNSIGVNYQTINADNMWFDYSLLILCIAAAFKLTHVTTFMMQCRNFEVPRSSPVFSTGPSAVIRKAKPLTTELTSVVNSVA